MGSSESTLNSTKHKVTEFNKKYNWVLSYPQREREVLSEKNITKIIGSINSDYKSYVDLRVNCPPILDINTIPLHPIASVCSLLNYQLNKNKLPTFPPSRLFIYKNISFFPDVKSVISYETIFNSLVNYGFCSEIDYSYSLENLEYEPSSKNYEVAEAFKFIDIFRVDNNIEFIKKLLQNDIPLLIGVVLYYDLSKIVDSLWLPDMSIDNRVGGTTGVLVGYSDDRQCFFLKMAYGKNFGASGYIMIPYEYVKDITLVPEIYYMDLKKNRIEGFLNQRREIISLQNKPGAGAKYQKCDNVESFFS